MPYNATRQHVHNRGRAPVAFLDELVAWGKAAPDEIFAPNPHSDIYSSVRNTLGPWESLQHRRAVMLEVLRVLGGFESSWNWNAGRDESNDESDTPVEIEAGIFQVSANSMNFGDELRDLVRREAGATDPATFQRAMKANHRLAMEYCARLLRRTVRHHGPVRDFHIHPWLRRDAVEELQQLVGSGPAAVGEGEGGEDHGGAPVGSLGVGAPGGGGGDGGPPEVARAMAERARLGSNCNWIFEVDYSINSRRPRFFVYSIRDGKLYKYKCAHGIGGANRTPHDGRTREVSNVEGSHCSSLGVIETGEHYDSTQVGEAVRLHGLSPTNSNIADRGVVLHGGNYVSDNESSTDTSICGRSWGCIVVDDRYIDRETGGELIEWLKDGSIGVAHYNGEFSI